MSPSSPLTTERVVPQGTKLPSLLAQFWSLVTRPVMALAFWLAIVLPVLLVGLALNGLPTTTHQALFGSILAVNVVSLVLGHGHRRD